MSSSHVDRNLLFGFLALQNNFISHGDLIAAVSVWLTDKSRPLDEILSQRRALVDDERQLLEALVRKHLQKHGNDAEKSLAALSSVGKLRDDLKKLGDADVEASLAHVAQARPSKDFDPDATLQVDPATVEKTRFRILRPHAAGGLGQVYVARDDELNRDVALKEIKFDHVDDSESRARFLLEAEITGGLEHPGIVPVYGLGQYADGRPYYAMRFIRGDSLKEAVERFHKQGQASPPSYDSVEFRNLLGRFIDVCNAIEYAHSRGVLHRDLKPGNIMLGKYGETLVVDWGLAKTKERSEQHQQSDEQSLQPRSSSGSAATQMGSAVGTPAYMSPEQAAGRLDQLGPASDVYSLGATLYSVLTGQVPFAKANAGDILRKVQSGEFTPPRLLCLHIPRPLEAICLKAMALRPADRYASPQALSNDIEHYLADEPVSVVTNWPGARVARWLRKHRGVAATLAISLFLLTCGAVLFGLVVVGSSQLIEEARQRESERADAEALQRKRADDEAASAKTAIKFARGEFYAAQMQLAANDWKAGNIKALRTRLVETRPNIFNGEDYRRFEWYYWDSKINSCIFERSIEPDGIVKTRSNGTEEQLAALQSEASLKTWDAVVGSGLCSKIRGSLETNATIIFSQDRSRIARKQNDGPVTIWDVATGSELVALAESDKKLSASDRIGFNRTGTRLFNRGGYGHPASVWDTTSGALLLALPDFEHSGERISAATFDDEGSRILAGGSDGTIWLWDAATGLRLLEIKGHSGSIEAVAFNQDGSLFATSSDDRAIKIWNVGANEPLHTLVVGSQDWSSPKFIAFSPDDKRLLTINLRNIEQSSLKVWDLSDGRELLSIPTDKWLNAAQFSADGQRALAWDESYFGAWDILPDRTQRKFENRPSSEVAFHSATARFVRLDRDGNIELFDLKTGEKVAAWRGDKGGRCLSFNGDGSHIVYVGRSGVSVHEAASGKAVAFNRQRADVIDPPNPHRSWALAYSADGSRLATVTADGAIRLWDTKDAQLLVEFQAQSKSINQLLVNQDGSRVACSRAEGDKIQVWDTATLKELCSLPQRGQRGIAINPAGNLVVIGYWDGARIWDVATGQALKLLSGHSGPISCVAFTPDGTRIATNSLDDSVRIWDTTSGRELLSLETGIGCDTVAFSDDGSQIFSADLNTVRIWDAFSMRNENR